MSCEEMIEELLAVEKPDARLRRFLKWCNFRKQKDGTYHSVRKCGRLPIVEPVYGEYWERMLAEWIAYVRGGEAG